MVVVVAVVVDWCLLLSLFLVACYFAIGLFLCRLFSLSSFVPHMPDAAQPSLAVIVVIVVVVVVVVVLLLCCCC